jgi:hypothetical protein
MEVHYLKMLKKAVFFIILLLSLTSAKNISNSINFTVGIPELMDIKYGLEVKRVSFYIRPGIGWYFFYMVRNDNSWEIFPEVSISYCLLEIGDVKIGPEIGLAYLYHDGYYNYSGSSNYFEKSKTDNMFENIKAKLMWNPNKSGFVIGGTIGFSIIEDIYQGEIIENNAKKHKTAIDGIGVFPLLTLEIGCKF